MKILTFLNELVCSLESLLCSTDVIRFKYQFHPLMNGDDILWKSLPTQTVLQVFITRHVDCKYVNIVKQTSGKK